MSPAGEPAAIEQAGHAIVITDTRTPQASFDAMIMAMSRHGLGEDHILAPQLLHITPRPRRPARGPTA